MRAGTASSRSQSARRRERIRKPSPGVIMGPTGIWYRDSAFKGSEGFRRGIRQRSEHHRCHRACRTPGSLRSNETAGDRRVRARCAGPGRRLQPPTALTGEALFSGAISSMRRYSARRLIRDGAPPRLVATGFVEDASRFGDVEGRKSIVGSSHQALARPAVPTAPSSGHAL
jgi:hypothetical protein